MHSAPNYWNWFVTNQIVLQKAQKFTKLGTLLHITEGKYYKAKILSKFPVYTSLKG